MGINPEEFKRLAAPFAAKDHEFNRGFIYIEETAICARIEEVDLSWEWKTIEITRESDVAYVVGALTINGVTRYGTGQQVIQRDKEGKESVGEATKGATTDTMKRAARLFGIGRYLLQCPKEVKDYGAALNNWLASLNGQRAVSAQDKPVMDRTPAPINESAQKSSPAPVASKPQPPAWWPVLGEYQLFMRDEDFNFMRNELSEGVKSGALKLPDEARARAYIVKNYGLLIDEDAMRAAAKEAM